MLFRYSIVSCLILILLASCKKEEKTLFSKMSANQTGINFKNLVNETEDFNILTYGNIYNGGGVSVGDLNNDGLQDLYFTGSMVGSRLYINKGNFKFDEIAEKAGVFAAGLWNTGTTMVDINADGYLDIYVCRSAAKDDYKRKNLLFINNGDLTFTEQAEKYGIADDGYSTQAAFFDYDKDGDLDLYVLNHSIQQYASFNNLSNQLKSRRNYYFEDHFYINKNGAYRLASDEVGLTNNVLGFGLSIAVSDMNNDNWPDIYISNDFHEEDYFYINNQDGTFSEKLRDYFSHTSQFSMGSDAADINNDGYMDLITLDMLPESNYRQKMVLGPHNYDKYQIIKNNDFYEQSMRNMLQLNNHGNSFSEIGQYAGVHATDWSWAPLIADFDNDGFKDIFITNGLKKDYTNMDFMNFAVQQKMKEIETGAPTAISVLLENMPAIIEENYLFKNNQNLTFDKVNQDWGITEKNISNGAVYADLDNDGDLDLIVNNTNDPASIYRNNTMQLDSNHYLKIHLKGSRYNNFGIGAIVELQIGDNIIKQEMMPTRGFQSSVDYNLIFGLGKNEMIDKLKITWPDLKQQTLHNLKTNQFLHLNYNEAQYVEKIPNKDTLTPIFTKGILEFGHVENEYNDFLRERLLPHKLSNSGPKLTKGDVNGDGLEDIYLGGSKGFVGQLLIQKSVGQFVDVQIKDFILHKESEDAESLFFDADNDGDLDLYVISGGSQDESNTPNLQDRLYVNKGSGQFYFSSDRLPALNFNGSTITKADIDDDGDMDLFVGGATITGKYPESERSVILINDGNGYFKEDPGKINVNLSNLGFVKDAIFTDFNADDLSDLIVVGEFMKIRVFKNTNGILKELQHNSGLEHSEGWWNTIEEGDLDSDGDMDYIIGNHGYNSQLKASIENPVSLYVADFDQNGSLDPILCSYNSDREYIVYSKDDFIEQIPGKKNQYVNYSDFANHTVTEIFSESQLNQARKLVANNFATTYMENKGNGQFELHDLPSSSQFAPVYAAMIDDFNADGNLDVILGGNFHGHRVQLGQYDANKGVLLFGNGQGEFLEATMQESGLNINGEVRDISQIKSKDGSNLIIFARNNDELGLYTY